MLILTTLPFRTAPVRDDKYPRILEYIEMVDDLLIAHSGTFQNTNIPFFIAAELLACFRG